jgi:hypothetical protein
MLYKRLGVSPLWRGLPHPSFTGQRTEASKASLRVRWPKREKEPNTAPAGPRRNTDDEAQVHRLRQNQLAVRLPRLLPDLLRSRAAARTSAQAADLRRLQSALHDYANGCALLLGRVQAARISPPRYRKAWVYWKPTFIRNTRDIKKPGFTVGGRAHIKYRGV